MIGGHAVGYHGYVRATGDIDIWYAYTPENIQAVVKTLRAYGFNESSIPTDLFDDPTTVIRMGFQPSRFELLADISGVDFASCWLKRLQVTLDDTLVNIIDLESLKQNKQASGRPKDLNDLYYLERKNRKTP
jgi:hypothetical protein